MIRVVYKFKLLPGHADRFAAAWREGTLHMREHVPGSRGSVLLSSHGDTDGWIAIARWDSVQAWKGRSLPAHISAAMKACQSADTTFELFEEVTDLTA